MSRRIEARDIIDLPDKGAMLVGGGAVLVGVVIPGAQFLISPGLNLIAIGGTGLGVTRAMIPRKD